MLHKKVFLGFSEMVFLKKQKLPNRNLREEKEGSESLKSGIEDPPWKRIKENLKENNESKQ